MKKICSVLLAAFTMLAVLPASAQLRKIPSEVTEGFKQKYPAASEVEWRDKLKGFSADFKLEDVAYTAYFNNKGEWESTEQVIEEDALPEPVKESYQKSKYSEWEIGRIHKIELPEDEVQYRVEAVKNDIKKRNLYFNPEGKMLKDKLTL